MAGRKLGQKEREGGKSSATQSETAAAGLGPEASWKESIGSSRVGGRAERIQATKR